MKGALSKDRKATVLSDTEKVALSLNNLVAHAERGDMKIHTLPKDEMTPDQVLVYLKSV